jgi:hypothetical protein
MAQTVFILGAGASHEGGAPVMSNFIDVAEGLMDSASVNKASFQLLFRALHQLQAVQIKSQLNTDNLEEVFGAFEMAKLTGRFGDLTEAELGELSAAIRTVIVQTIETTLQFPLSTGEAPVLAPKPYGKFADLIADMSVSEKVTVATFNYDIGLDYAVARRNLAADYALDATFDAYGTFDAHVELLKLHGSMGWTQCRSCGFVEKRNELARGPWYPMMGSAPSRVLLSPLLAKQKCNKCAQPSPDPMIVPPTFNKTQYHQQISSVWQRARIRLSEAENIFVIGYSLPRTDQFFRYLFGLGTVGTTRLKRFWVFDPMTTVAENYESLVGPAVKSRFQHRGVNFGEAINTLRSELDIKSSRKAHASGSLSQWS